MHLGLQLVGYARDGTHGIRPAVDSAQPVRDAKHIRVCDRQEVDTAGSASGCMSSNCFRYAHSNPPEYHIVHKHMLPWFEY